MHVIKRNDAAAMGLSKYSTGKPCGKGHDSERYTTSGQCIACLADNRTELQNKRNILNAKLGTQHVQVPCMARREHFPAYKQLEAIIDAEDPTNMVRIFAMLREMTGPAAEQVTYRPEMTRRDLLRYATIVDGKITNGDDFDIVDDYDPVADEHCCMIYMNSNWYHMHDVVRLLPEASYALIRPGMMPEHMKPIAMKNKIV